MNFKYIEMRVAIMEDAPLYREQSSLFASMELALLDLRFSDDYTIINSAIAWLGANVVTCHNIGEKDA